MQIGMGIVITEQLVPQSPQTPWGCVGIMCWPPPLLMTTFRNADPKDDRGNSKSHYQKHTHWGHNYLSNRFGFEASHSLDKWWQCRRFDCYGVWSSTPPPKMAAVPFLPLACLCSHSYVHVPMHLTFLDTDRPYFLEGVLKVLLPMHLTFVRCRPQGRWSSYDLRG